LRSLCRLYFAAAGQRHREQQQRIALRLVAFTIHPL
jgi:hypothetical protein